MEALGAAVKIAPFKFAATLQKPNYSKLNHAARIGVRQQRDSSLLLHNGTRSGQDQRVLAT